MKTQLYIRAYVEDKVRDGVWKFALRTVAKVLDWLITLAVGYEVNKITSDDEPRDIWTFVEFFVVVALCVLIWVMKCCCLNKFCITCCINCMVKRGGQDEEIGQNENEIEGGKKLSPFESVLAKVHMILNRLVVGAVGFELRKQLFKMKALTLWDYVEISIIALFCLWVLMIKYCILKCHCLTFCCCCCRLNGRLAEKGEDIAMQCTQNEAVDADADRNRVNEQLPNSHQPSGSTGVNNAAFDKAEVYNQV